MSRVTIKLLGEMVNSFVFFMYAFISSDFEQKSLTNERIYDMINDHKKEPKMHSEIGARQLKAIYYGKTGQTSPSCLQNTKFVSSWAPTKSAT